MNVVKKVFLILVMIALWGTPAQAGPPAQGPDADDAARLVDELNQAGQGKVRVSHHEQTGKVRFIGATPSAPIKQPAVLPASATAEDAARGFLAKYGPLFGLSDQANELAVMTQQTSGDDRSFTRFQQVYQGIPVLGGELVVQTVANQDILSANGEILPDAGVDTKPAIDADTARQRALALVAKGYNLTTDELAASEPELWIFNPILLRPGAGRTSLVWRIDVTPLELLPLRELVLVDAHLGAVVLHFNQIDSARNRLVYDNNNNPAFGLPGNGPVRTEGGSATGITDADLAYDYAGDTYDFFSSQHGRDSLDNAGMALVSTTRYCPDALNCPYGNAFWNGSQMAYGQGFPEADDVVGHELTHGVTDFSSHLFYYYQSGAINESLSDVWGEFIDQTNGSGTDTAGVKWLMGEDIPGFGAIRDMEDPTTFGDPDRITSGNYYCGELDSGGVHTNSGVNNKAAYLMTDGGTFNGFTVTGLGISKVADLYYEVQTNMLTSGSNYNDLYDALIQASINLAFTPADQQEVQDALNAVEMNQRPCGDPPEAPICPASQSPAHLFFDDMENTASGNWTSAAIIGNNEWYYPQTANPYFFDATYTSSGVYNLWGYNQPATANFYMAMTSDVALPANAYLHFKHDWAFEDFGLTSYDGGVLEYSTDGGVTWIDAGPLFSDNGYNGAITNSFGNPLGGQSAFTGESRGYTASRLDLSGLAGQNVRFRFRIGTDSSVDALGWFIDDVRLYTCAVSNVVLVYDSHLIDDDNLGNSSGNGDGAVDAGETIELYVDVRNNGLDAATAVQVCLSEDSPYVSGFLFNTCSDYGDIPGGGVTTNVNDFDFAVDPSAPDGHVINFTLTASAGNGGPWTDAFSLTVNNAGGIRVGLISDGTELAAVAPILDDMALAYDVLNNNWNGSQGIYTSDFNVLSSYEVVVWYGSGAGFGRLITQAEHDALELYLGSGGRLLVTGYDTLGSPTDTLLADIVRSSSSGDGPFVYNYSVTDGSHPIMNGPFGSFPTGTTLTAGHSDHDQAEADTGRNATTVAELVGGRDKIIATDLDPASADSGRIVYWNGNLNARDWVGQTTVTLNGVETLVAPEAKRDVEGRAPVSNEALAAQAQHLDPAEIPPEANYGGEGPALRLDGKTAAALQPEPGLLASVATTFIASGDTVSVLYDPYWWNAGDYAEGVRTLSLDSVEHTDYTLVIGDNLLSGSGRVDFNLSINGIVVGSFSVLPGELVKNVSFDFPAIAGPTYTIRLEETNTVDFGAGSITLPLNQSTLVLSSSQPDILKNALFWLAEGAGVGSDPHEPNNSPAACSDIFFDLPIADATIDPAGDSDYYCFSGSAGQTIAADVDAWQVGSALDPVLTLFDTDGTTILTENDDFLSLDSYLEYTLPGDGVYFLRVRSFGHPCCGGPSYDYSLLLTDITPAQSAPWSDDMESGANGWTANGFWHQVQDGVSPYPESHSPTHSWWYGQDASGNYDNGAANSGSLSSPAVNIPAGALGASLSFWSWYETETTETSWDQRWVQISIDGGPFQNLAQLSGDSMQTWTEHSFDLSPYAGSQVRVRFFFDTIDAAFNNYRGWYIDDVAINLASATVGPVVTAPPPTIDDDNLGNSSGDNDGNADPGETVELYIGLENQGTGTATNVAACLATTSPYVQFIFNDCSSYGNIPGGAVVMNLDDFDLAINPAAPNGHVIHFTANVTADNGGPWTGSFDVVVGGGTVTPGPVVYIDHLVDDDNSGQSSGDGDGLPNPGETIELFVDLLNAGQGTALGVNACLSEDSPYVNGFLFNACSDYGDIPGGGAATNFNDYEFTIDPTAPAGHQINFTATATALNGGPWVSTFSLVVVDGPILRLEPADQAAPLGGGSFIVNVVVDNATDLGAFEFDLVYNPAIVQVSAVNLGDFLGSTGRTVSEVGPTIDNGTGRTSYGAFSVGSNAGPSGSGLLATIVLAPQQQGDSDLLLDNFQLTNTDASVLASTALNGHVTVTNSFFADVDSDSDVDIVDVQLVASHVGCAAGAACYDSPYDLDNDLDIDITDVQIDACYWGWPSGDFSSCYTPTATSSVEVQQGATVSIKPQATAVDGNEVFTITVEVANAVNLGAFGFELHYDPSVVVANNVTLGSFLGSTGRPIFEAPTNSIDNLNGKVLFSAATLGSSPAGPNGDGTLATLVLTARDVTGQSALDLLDSGEAAVGQTPLTLVTIGGIEHPLAGVEDGGVSVALPALTISKEAQPQPVTAGTRLTYTLTISNLSDAQAATGVVINDELPNQTVFAWADNGGVVAGNQVQWTGQTVGAGGTLTVRFAVTVSESFAGAELVNSVYSAFANDQGVSATGAPVTSAVKPSPAGGVKIHLPMIMKNAP
ncbi:MAG: M4 family metallopeptidase [Anaerolineae bacterium]